MNDQSAPNQPKATEEALVAYKRRRWFRMVSGVILGVALLVVLARGIYVVLQVSKAGGP